MPGRCGDDVGTINSTRTACGGCIVYFYSGCSVAVVAAATADDDDDGDDGDEDDDDLMVDVDKRLLVQSPTLTVVSTSFALLPVSGGLFPGQFTTTSTRA
ncbi:hypothetical protein ElyMa_001766700 [Elysia marginata]|uniref:Uncharacterized protein n=1 Tax=Elysia marginata TaxID=1093978 RepID=A0AAV4EC67_9GAST|nr:hypothetical protein ElyMa_001766700 [Elysia marginata]